VAAAELIVLDHLVQYQAVLAVVDEVVVVPQADSQEPLIQVAVVVAEVIIMLLQEQVVQE
jgi:hypothetical protein